VKLTTIKLKKQRRKKESAGSGKTKNEQMGKGEAFVYP
jgi:hypothetical protein